MVVDFHTHIFPHKIVERTIAMLAENSHTQPATDGTYEGLCASGERSGVDLSIVLPPVTKPTQTKSINRYAATHLEGPVISFGGIHPENDNYKEILRDIKSMGMKGIKLHPDYQGCYFNDIRYKRIVSYASELGLIVSAHAGRDPKSPQDVHNTPQMALEMIREVQPEKFVLAHMGGSSMWDEVEEYLVGENVYFDTGVVIDTISEEQFVRIVKNHGADKILFGTDSPWRDQKHCIDVISAMPLTEDEKEKIFSQNAMKLLDF
jgi:hypothetical protein